MASSRTASPASPSSHFGTQFRGARCHLSLLVLSLPGSLAKLVPEEHTEDGVGAQAQVGRTQSLVECQGALKPPDLQQAVSEAPIQLTLETDGSGVTCIAAGMPA